MKVQPLLLGLFGAGLAACGSDKNLLVGEERGNIAGAASLGFGGTGAPGGTNGASGPGGASGGGSSGSFNGGMGPGPGPGPGPSPQECLDMAREYKTRLGNAQACMPPEPSTPEPCTRPMPDDLLCRCPTFVNPGYDDIPRLEYLIAETMDCPRTCEPNSCRQVTSGVCMLDQNLDPPRPHCFAVP